MNLLFTESNTRYTGVPRANRGSGSRLVWKTAGADVCVVTFGLTSGTVTNTVIKIRRGVTAAGPWFDYGTAETINAASFTSGQAVSSVLQCDMDWMACEVTTGEGSDLFLNVGVNLKKLN